KPPAKASARTAAVTHTAATKPSPAPAPLAPIDRRLKARLKRGTQAIDARIDLHGMIQSEAHAALVPGDHRQGRPRRRRPRARRAAPPGAAVAAAPRIPPLCDRFRGRPCRP